MTDNIQTDSINSIDNIVSHICSKYPDQLNVSTQHVHGKQYFIVSITIDGKVYSERGENDILTKVRLCNKVFKLTNSNLKSNQKSVASKFHKPIKQIKKKKTVQNLMTHVGIKKIVRGGNINDIVAEKGLLQTLNEYIPGNTCVSQLYGSGEMAFKSEVKILGECFDGYGTSKKNSRINAANLCLRHFYPDLADDEFAADKHEVSNSDFYSNNDFIPVKNTLYNIYSNLNKESAREKVNVDYQSMESEIKPEEKMEIEQELDEEKYDQVLDINCEYVTNSIDQLPEVIYKIVNEKFNSITLETEKNCNHIISGILITVNDDLNSPILVTVTSGSKTIAGDYLSHEGHSINDGHAEIVARRCLNRYILNRIDNMKKLNNFKTTNDQLLEFNQLTEKYRIKDTVKIHLYISSAPCGDGRIFSKNADQVVAKSSHGLLRVKIESGMGTVLPGDLQIQTMDGILSGERMLTMSCSDKIAIWNLLGLQGSLLSNIIEPYYLSSLTVGNQFNLHHLTRAIHSRIESVPLTNPYSVNCPIIKNPISSNISTRLTKKFSDTGVLYICDRSENIFRYKITTGESLYDETNPICKRSMYKKFLKIAAKMKLPWLNSDMSDISYLDAKCFSTKYNENKKIIMNYFMQQKMGTWIGKPLEVDKFYITKEDFERYDDYDCSIANVLNVQNMLVDESYLNSFGNGSRIYDVQVLDHHPQDENWKGYFLIHKTVLELSKDEAMEIKSKMNK